jgi:hypothetical protein
MPPQSGNRIATPRFQPASALQEHLRMRRLAMLSLLLLPLAATAQSHNTSTNCSNGRCTRIKTWSPNGAPPWMPWQRVGQWREGPRRDWRHAP